MHAGSQKNLILKTKSHHSFKEIKIREIKRCYLYSSDVESEESLDEMSPYILPTEWVLSEIVQLFSKQTSFVGWYNRR